MRGKKWYWLAGGALIGLSLAAGAVYESLSAANDAKQPPPGKLVDAGGLHLHVLCAGKREGPTVVLDAGLGDASLVWADVQARLAPYVRVCAYDRAGIAWSEQAKTPRTSQSAAAELHALLQAAGESGPYILVGHSAGVNYIRLFAHTYPETVKGLVLVEPPILQQASPALVHSVSAIRWAIGALARVGGVRLLAGAGQLGLLYGGAHPPQAVVDHAAFLYRPQSIAASIQETQALPEIIREMNLAAHAQAWRDWPVTIIAAHRGSAPPPELAGALEDLARLSLRGKVVTVAGSHAVHFEHPQLVAETILEIARSQSWIRP
jgi:pimeloyl-ACP methyl ester carboxylesterase